MRQVVIAFAVTGPSPQAGHRISELVAVEQADGQATGRRLHFSIETGDATSAVQFDALDNLVGDAPIIVLDAGKWRRFIRVELRSVKRRGARRLLNHVVDIGAWAHQRFPRQRKDVAAIARRLGIEAPELSGLEREAELLRLVAAKMNSVPVVAPVAEPNLPKIDVATPPVAQGNRWFVDRMERMWRALSRRK